MGDIGLANPGGTNYDSSISVGSPQLTPGPSKAETFRTLGSVGLDLDSNGIRAAYLDYFSNLKNEDYKNPDKMQEALDLMKVGIDLWGDSARPKYGWGAGNNHTDPYFVNMVKVIQATIGMAEPTGYYGPQTRDLLSVLNSGYRGSVVGQRMLRLLSNLNQKIANNYRNGLVYIDFVKIKEGVIPYLEQFTARRLYILAKRAKELGIDFRMIDLFRTTALQRQYYKDWQDGKMPWTNVVARPETSPHEAGIAFDVDGAALDGIGKFEAFKELALKVGFSWQGPGDRCHYGMYLYDYNRVQEVRNAQSIYNSF